MYQFMNIEIDKNHYMNSCINNQTTINTQVKYDNKNNDSIEIIHRIHTAVYQRLKQEINLKILNTELHGCFLFTLGLGF